MHDISANIGYSGSRSPTKAVEDHLPGVKPAVEPCSKHSSGGKYCDPLGTMDTETGEDCDGCKAKRKPGKDGDKA